MNFVIELKVITAGCGGMNGERLVVADTKDQAYDKFFANPIVKATMAKAETFSVSLRQVGEIK